jgi:hypothetical protein
MTSTPFFFFLFFFWKRKKEGERASSDFDNKSNKTIDV